LSAELRGIFVEELRGLHHELDDEVAKLSSLGEMAPAMANVMRHLHTIKGSSLMAEANTLGDLTHHTESFLESNFIRNEDDLRNVRKTLELFVDAVDTASNAYQGRQQFVPPSDLLAKLGVAADAKVDQEAAKAEIIQAAKEADQEAQAEDELIGVDITEELTQIASQISDVSSNWKSAKGWKKIRPQMLDQCAALGALVDDSGGVLSDIAPQ